MSAEALVTPRLLAWARVRSGLSTSELAKKLGQRSAAKVEAWEDAGSGVRPTFKQAQQLAHHLHVPLGYLFLRTPPDEGMPLPDLRTRRDPGERKPSPEFLEVMYDALRKQEWYHSYLEAQDVEPLPFVERFSDASTVLDVAADIRRTLGINDALRRAASNNDEYFRLLAARCEQAGVVVVRSGVVGGDTHRSLDADEVQGFAKTDPLAPLVFVNQNDYLSAQIFTLAHELAHIWIGVSGVSDSEYLLPEDDIHQRHADRIAAEVLVPAADFVGRWDGLHGDHEQRLDAMRRHYKVSIFVLVRRAFDLGRITADDYRSLWRRFKGRIIPKRGSGGGGYSSMVSRNSRAVTTAVVGAVFAGHLQPTQGAALLNCRPPTLYNLGRALMAGEV